MNHYMNLSGENSHVYLFTVTFVSMRTGIERYVCLCKKAQKRETTWCCFFIHSWARISLSNVIFLAWRNFISFFSRSVWERLLASIISFSCSTRHNLCKSLRLTNKATNINSSTYSSMRDLLYTFLIRFSRKSRLNFRLQKHSVSYSLQKRL